MDVKAGSYSAPKGGNLKYYKEEEVETSTYKLIRVFNGNKLLIKLLVNDANTQELIELIPQGVITRFYFIRMGMHLLADRVIPADRGSTRQIGVEFNNLTINNVLDGHSFSNYYAGDVDELKRFEDDSHTYYGVSTNIPHPTVYDKPFTVILNNGSGTYANTIAYELTIELNIYDQ